MRRGRDDFSIFVTQQKTRGRSGMFPASDSTCRSPATAGIASTRASGSGLPLAEPQTEGVPAPSVYPFDALADAQVAQLRATFAMMQGRST